MGNRTTVRKPEGGDFTVAPEGLHQAVCVDVWDVYTESRPEEYGGGLVDKTRLVWEIDQADPKTNKPIQVHMIYTASLHEKAKLRQHLESWRGRKFTQAELEGFDLEHLIGVNCQLQVIHRIGRNGNTYGNVSAIVPLGKGMQKLTASPGFMRKKDRPTANSQNAQQQPLDENLEDDDVPF